MKLPPPSPGYDNRDQREMRSQLEQADQQNHKRGRDVEIGVGRLVLTSPNGTRYSITVSNAGAVSAAAI